MVVGRSRRNGLHRDDCLELVRELVGDELPPVVYEIADASVDHEALGIDRSNWGNPVWRGVWGPSINPRGADRCVSHRGTSGQRGFGGGRRSPVKQLPQRGAGDTGARVDDGSVAD